MHWNVGQIIIITFTAFKGTQFWIYYRDRSIFADGRCCNFVPKFSSRIYGFRNRFTREVNVVCYTVMRQKRNCKKKIRKEDQTPQSQKSFTVLLLRKPKTFHPDQRVLKLRRLRGRRMKNYRARVFMRLFLYLFICFFSCAFQLFVFFHIWD